MLEQDRTYSQLAHEGSIRGLNLPESNLSKISEEAVTNLDRYLVWDSFGAKPLIGKQRTIFREIRKALANGTTEMHIDAPPGYGKTVLYAKLSEALGLRTLIVAPTTVIIDQTGDKINEFTMGLDFGKIYQKQKEFGRKITITTYDSFLAKAENGSFDPNDFDFLILDEVHEALSARQQAAVTRFKGKAIIIGGTATPKYSEDKQVPKLLPTKAIGISIQEAIKEGRLSSVQAYVAVVDADYSDASISGAENYREKDLQRRLDKNVLNKAAVDIYLNFERDGIPIKGQRALAYCETIRDAEELARLFIENGVPAEAISGRDSVLQKQKKLERFDSGEIKVLANVDLLVPGFDQPKAAVCLNLRRTFSLVVAGQRIRVLRVDFGNPDKVGLVFDIFLRDQLAKSKNIPITAAAIINGLNITRDESHKRAISAAAIGAKDNSEDKGIVISQEEKEEGIVISGVRITQDLKKAFELIRAKENFRQNIAEKGQVSLKQLAGKLHVSRKIILGILQDIGSEALDKHPELTIKEVIGKNGRRVKTLSPALVEKVAKRADRLKNPPQGAMHIEAIVRLLKKMGYRISSRIVKESFDKIGSENINETGIHKVLGSNKYTRYAYDPVVNLILMDVAGKVEYPSPPKGWPTVTKLYLKLKKRYSADYEFVKAEAESLREEDSSGFGLFRAVADGKGGVTGIHEYLSLENALRIEEKARMRFESKPPFAELGWMSYGDYRRSRGIHDAKAKKVAGQFRPDHPDWFAINSRMTGKPSEHMHPDLVKQLDIIFGVETISFEHIVFDRRLIQEKKTAIIVTS